MEPFVLFPTVDVPELLPEEEEYEGREGTSAGWDLTKGDFIRNGANQIVACDEREAYRIWCCKMALTQRSQCPAYPDGFGAELAKAFSEQEDGEGLEAALEQAVTEAVMSHPRTEDVGEFSFTQEGDTLICSFTVKGRGWEEMPIRIAMERQGQKWK